MVNSYHVTGTLIAPGPLAEARLWVDCPIWPARSVAEAAAQACVRTCADEAIDPADTRWSADLRVRETGITLHLADDHWLRWAQHAVATRHYLHAPVDPRCSPLAYIVAAGDVAIGCLIFGRPQSTCCYDGELTYGSVGDVERGRAQYSRWQIINLARVWLDPSVQRGGVDHIPRLASTAIRVALDRIGIDYLVQHPPCFPDEPWVLQKVISYCDSRIHTGYLYRVCRFRHVRTNVDGIETFAKDLRPLTTDERDLVTRLARQHPRSRRYRSARVDVHDQARML